MATKSWTYMREREGQHKYCEEDANYAAASPKKVRLVLPKEVKTYIISKNKMGMTAHPIAAALKSHFWSTIDQGVLDSISVAKVQNFIKNHSRDVPHHMSIHTVKDAIVGTEYCENMQDCQGFTFGYGFEDGKPLLGMGSDCDPFIVCFSSKVWIRNFFRALDAITTDELTSPVFMLHIDGSFKLNLLGYPVIVLGISDASRKFYPLGFALVSQTTSAV
ncbi:MAG: hypothetical protein ACRDL7_02250, partial [Gaiellaceae bacterium]